MRYVNIHHYYHQHGAEAFAGDLVNSVAVVAVTSVQSPRKFIVCIIRKNIFWLKVSQKYFIHILFIFIKV